MWSAQVVVMKWANCEYFETLVIWDSGASRQQECTMKDVRHNKSILVTYSSNLAGKSRKPTALSMVSLPPNPPHSYLTCKDALQAVSRESWYHDVIGLKNFDG